MTHARLHKRAAVLNDVMVRALVICLRRRDRRAAVSGACGPSSSALARHQPRFHAGMRGLGAVMKRAENLVPGHFQIAVVAFEIPVVHLMMERAQRKTALVLDQKAFKTRV